MVQQLGSRRYFQYTADNGSEYAVELDESIAETAALGFEPLGGQRDVISLNSTRPLRGRYVNLVRVADGNTIRAKQYIGSPAAFVDLQSAGSVTIGGETWGISTPVGERRQLVPLTDTEQLDGDVDTNIASGG